MGQKVVKLAKFFKKYLTWVGVVLYIKVQRCLSIKIPPNFRRSGGFFYEMDYKLCWISSMRGKDKPVKVAI